MSAGHFEPGEDVAPAARRLDRRRPGGDLLSRSAILLLLALLATCQRPSTPAARPASNEPKIRATVVTIQTTMPPSPKSWTHTIVIANGRARSTDEVDEWRLFDFNEKRVTFVDDLAKTYRTVSFDDVAAAHRTAMARPLPDGLPRAELLVRDAQKTIQGVVAKQSMIRIGAYQRELWIASHPLIPQGLFAIMQASEPVSSPLAGMMHQVDDALFDVKGFPLSDHAELPYEKKKLVVDNTVVSIDQREVPATLLNVNGAYREVKSAPETAKPQARAK